MSKVNRTLVKMLTEIGFKNLFVIIILPSVFDLDRYVALWRSKALFHVYTGDKWERGYFSCYNKERLKDLYVRGKKFYEYGVVRPNFYGRFTRKYMVDKDEYNNKKRKAADNADEKKVQEEEAKEIIYNYLMQQEDLSHAERIKILKMPESTYFWRLRNEKY